MLCFLVSAGICSCGLFGRVKFHKVTIVMDDSCGAEQQSAAFEVINKRIASIWKVKEVTEPVNGRFDITYSGNDSLLMQLLSIRGDISVSETYADQEMFKAVSSLYEKVHANDLIESERREALDLWDTEYSVDNIFWLPYSTSNYMESPVVVMAEPQYVAFADSIFNGNKDMFPADASFCWSYKSQASPMYSQEREDIFELYALRSDSPEFKLNADAVFKSRIDSYELTYSLDIWFNEQHAKQWARLTGDNIYRQLAVVMDGKVLMCPRVAERIDGGRVSITGGLHYEDLLLIKAAISGGILDCKVRVEV